MNESVDYRPLCLMKIRMQDDQNLVPIAFGFSAIHIADKCQKRLLKAGPNTYIAHIFHIQTQAVKLSHPEGI